MALLRLRRRENVPGDFFVDESCIDCDLCRQIAPSVFSEAGDQSAVHRQPQGADEEFQALKALVTCPTASIGTVRHHRAKEAVEAYPEQVEEEVYFCGFAAESSFGASSYFIRSSLGNILIDSPRFARPLAKRIEQMGGVRMMLLTHRDDVADHDQWAKQFKCERVIHVDDAGRLRGKVERLIDGQDPVQLREDLLVLPTPGHTRGHVVFLFNERYLFTGDHLWWSDHYGSLHASRSVCWYSWADQIKSMEKLRDYKFAWVLPGHGRRVFAQPPQMKIYLEECIARMKTFAP